MFTSTTGGAVVAPPPPSASASSKPNFNNSNNKPTHRPAQASTSSLRSSLEIVPYTPLNAQEVDDALVALAHPYTGLLDPTDPESVVKADGVSFQPCRAVASQDRYVVEQFACEEEGGMWTLTGVFDGHLGTATVEHTAHHLPVIIQDFLSKEFARNPALASNPSSYSSIVADVLKRAISSFDSDIVRDVAELFPGGLDTDSLERLSDEEIRRVINDYEGGLANYKKVQLCLYGTTALVALVDPSRENLWVANLGDCQAVLATRRADGSWGSEFLTRSHNGSNAQEVARVRGEHPGEPECIKHGRVLGAIAPFRCIGDQPFKLPAPFTRRVLFNLDACPGSNGVNNNIKGPWEQFLQRNRTPPYISAEAEVVHRSLSSSSSSSSAPTSTSIFAQRVLGRRRREKEVEEAQEEEQPNHFLILCTDGLADLFEDVRGPQELAERYVAAVISPSSSPSSSPYPQSSPISTTSTHSFSSPFSSPFSTPNQIRYHHEGNGRGEQQEFSFRFSLSENYALKLLRSALGGADLDAVSQLLTVQTEKAWVDDTTVVVQVL